MRATYSVTGPHRGQDGRPVYHLVRRLPQGPARPVMEFLRPDTADAVAQHLQKEAQATP